MCQVFPRPNPIRTLAHHEAPSKCVKHGLKYSFHCFRHYFVLLFSIVLRRYCISYTKQNLPQ